MRHWTLIAFKCLLIKAPLAAKLCLFPNYDNQSSIVCKLLLSMSREKTSPQGFRPGLTQTDLYSHRSRLET